MSKVNQDQNENLSNNENNSQGQKSLFTFFSKIGRKIAQVFIDLSDDENYNNFQVKSDCLSVSNNIPYVYDAPSLNQNNDYKFYDNCSFNNNTNNNKNLGIISRDQFQDSPNNNKILNLNERRIANESNAEFFKIKNNKRLHPVQKAIEIILKKKYNINQQEDESFSEKTSIFNYNSAFKPINKNLSISKLSEDKNGSRFDNNVTDNLVKLSSKRNKKNLIYNIYKLDTTLIKPKVVKLWEVSDINESHDKIIGKKRKRNEKDDILRMSPEFKNKIFYNDSIDISLLKNRNQVNNQEYNNINHLEKVQKNSINDSKLSFTNVNLSSLKLSQKFQENDNITDKKKENEAKIHDNLAISIFHEDKNSIFSNQNYQKDKNNIYFNKPAEIFNRQSIQFPNSEINISSIENLNSSVDYNNTNLSFSTNYQKTSEKTLEQIRSEFNEKKKANQKVLDEINFRTKRVFRNDNSENGIFSKILGNKNNLKSKYPQEIEKEQEDDVIYALEQKKRRAAEFYDRKEKLNTNRYFEYEKYIKNNEINSYENSVDHFEEEGIYENSKRKSGAIFSFKNFKKISNSQTSNLKNEENSSEGEMIKENEIRKDNFVDEKDSATFEGKIEKISKDTSIYEKISILPLIKTNKIEEPEQNKINSIFPIDEKEENNNSSKMDNVDYFSNKSKIQPEAINSKDIFGSKIEIEIKEENNPKKFESIRENFDIVYQPKEENKIKTLFSQDQTKPSTLFGSVKVMEEKIGKKDHIQPIQQSLSTSVSDFPIFNKLTKNQETNQTEPERISPDRKAIEPSDEKFSLFGEKVSSKLNLLEPQKLQENLFNKKDEEVPKETPYHSLFGNNNLTNNIPISTANSSLFEIRSSNNEKNEQQKKEEKANETLVTPCFGKIEEKSRNDNLFGNNITNENISSNISFIKKVENQPTVDSFLSIKNSTGPVLSLLNGAMKNENGGLFGNFKPDQDKKSSIEQENEIKKENEDEKEKKKFTLFGNQIEKIPSVTENPTYDKVKSTFISNSTNQEKNKLEVSGSIFSNSNTFNTTNTQQPPQITECKPENIKNEEENNLKTSQNKLNLFPSPPIFNSNSLFGNEKISSESTHSRINTQNTSVIQPNSSIPTNNIFLANSSNNNKNTSILGKSSTNDKSLANFGSGSDFGTSESNVFIVQGKSENNINTNDAEISQSKSLVTNDNPFLQKRETINQKNLFSNTNQQIYANNQNQNSFIVTNDKKTNITNELKNVNNFGMGLFSETKSSNLSGINNNFSSNSLTGGNLFGNNEKKLSNSTLGKNFFVMNPSINESKSNPDAMNISPTVSPGIGPKQAYENINGNSLLRLPEKSIFGQTQNQNLFGQNLNNISISRQHCQIANNSTQSNGLFSNSGSHQSGLLNDLHSTQSFPKINNGQSGNLFGNSISNTGGLLNNSAAQKQLLFPYSIPQTDANNNTGLFSNQKSLFGNTTGNNNTFTMGKK